MTNYTTEIFRDETKTLNKKVVRRSLVFLRQRLAGFLLKNFRTKKSLISYNQPTHDKYLLLKPGKWVGNDHCPNFSEKNGTVTHCDPGNKILK